MKILKFRAHQKNIVPVSHFLFTNVDDDDLSPLALSIMDIVSTHHSNSSSDGTWVVETMCILGDKIGEYFFNSLPVRSEYIPLSTTLPLDLDLFTLSQSNLPEIKALCDLKCIVFKYNSKFISTRCRAAPAPRIGSIFLFISKPELDKKTNRWQTNVFLVIFTRNRAPTAFPNSAETLVHHSIISSTAKNDGSSPSYFYMPTPFSLDEDENDGNSFWIETLEYIHSMRLTDPTLCDGEYAQCYQSIIGSAADASKTKG